jgi:putative restriction endonuclease
MYTSQNSVGPKISVLESHAVRKAAREAGFDILFDQAGAVLGESSHAPEKCVVWTSVNNGFVAALTMDNVVRALEADYGTAIPPASLPGAPLQIVGGFLAVGIPALEALLKRAWILSRTLPNALVSRFEQSVAAISATEREATVRQRVGQNLFREGLMALWGGRCAITGLDVPELLRASHAKPWTDSNDVERLDVYNGLLLAAHWDAAFDAGLVTVLPDGIVATSSILSDSARRVLVVLDALRLKLQPQHIAYMAWHRKRVFRVE